MFTKSLSFAALALLLITSSSALPHRNAERGVEDLQVIRRGMIDIDDPSIVARNPKPFIGFSPASVEESDVSARDASPEPYYPPPIKVGTAIHKRDVPVEVAAKSDGNGVVPYKRDVPVEQAATTVNKEVVPYKRDVPVEVAAKSDGNGIVPYKRDVPVEVAAKSDGNGVVPYKRDVPVEVAAKSDGNEIVAYKRLETAGAAKRNVLKRSTAGPNRRSGRLYKRGNVRPN